MKDILKGLLEGSLVVIVIAVVLILISNILFAHDNVVAVRPATLGEQDRSLNFRYEDAEEETIVVVVEYVTDATTDIKDCTEINKLLQASKDYAEQRIEDNPKYGYLYDEVLALIKKEWCYDDD